MKTVSSHIKYIAAAVLAISNASCSDQGFFDSDSAVQMQEIRLSATYLTQSRADDQGFADGDMMGVYIVDYVEGKPGSISDDNIHVDNMKFTYNEDEAKWDGAAQLYWTSPDTHIDVYGYYPFTSTITPEAYSFQIQTRQDTPAKTGVLSGYEASDLLWAVERDIAPTDQTIRLSYRHAMAGVTIKLQEGNGFGEGEFISATKLVWMDNIKTTCNVNLATQDITLSDASATQIYPLLTSDAYRAVVVPQNIAKGNALICMTIDGENYQLSREKDTEYVSGKMHTFTVKIDKRESTGDYVLTIVDESITAWIDDPQFHEGLIREYILIDVAEPGTLKQTLIDRGINYSEAENLKIQGRVDWDDLAFIRDEMKMIRALNMFDMVIDDKDDSRDDVIGNLNNIEYLRHIVLPKKLRELADNAFFCTRLVGHIDIPEGVTRLGVNCLAQFHGNGGDSYGTISVTLPSTLIRIEDGAFFRTIMIGELNFPPGVEYIGGNAFSNGAFRDQRLILPENLKEIGASAITGQFIGDLEIPQGIKHIYQWTFSGATFTGNLILHEGLEAIDRQGFDGCGFKGELVLPSTLKKIDVGAFARNKFTNIIWPENLVTLGASAFEECNRLSGTITLPKNIHSINRSVFGDCNLITGVELHENIEYIGENAFLGCEYIKSIVCKSQDPPLMHNNAFYGLNFPNISVEVPSASVEAYQNDTQWSKFPRITAYSNFVFRPQKMCALNKEHYETVVLNADGAWTMTHVPEWCRVTPTKGNGKTEITVSIKELDHDLCTDRQDYVEVTLDNSGITTRLNLSQYDYKYDEDELVELQRHTIGKGIKIVMVPDGWNASEIASDSFMQQCLDNMEYFFGLAPYDRLRDFFDVYVALALSQDSGINTANVYVNTRFNTIYTYGKGLVDYKNCMFDGPQTLIPDEELIFEYLQDMHGFDLRDLIEGLTILIPNTIDYPSITYYYGNYGDAPISVCPPSQDAYPNDARGVIQHEACGHGFGKLGDESISNNAFIKSGVSGELANFINRGWCQNLALNGNLHTVPWAHLIFDARYSDYVDVFEGGYGYSRGVFRSEANSCMNFGIPYFNAISRQDITRRIYHMAELEFDLDEFFENDTKEWGKTQFSRSNEGQALIPYVNGSEPVMVKGNEMQNLLKTLRKQQQQSRQ